MLNSLTMALVAFLLLAPSSTLADADAESVSRPGTACHGEKTWKICDAHTGTGVCTRGGDEIVAMIRHQDVTIYSSGTAAYSCTPVIAFEGHDASAGVGASMNPAAVTDTAPSSVIYAKVDALWMNCTANAGTVTAYATVCPVE